MLQKLINLLRQILKINQKSSTSLENMSESANKVMPISIEAYFSDPKNGDDRRLKYPNDYTNEILENAKALLEKVNSLLIDLGVVTVVVSSGWRPATVNAAVGGAKRSLHMQGRAVDLRDSTGELDKLIESKPELLKKHGLWLEDPSATKGWCHLDCGNRTDRPSRVFKV
jgi:hypothetical protein